MERGPQVPLVSKPAPFACRGERLARAGSGPDGAVLWPSGEAQRKGPSADSGEEVALGESGEFTWADVFDGSFVHNSGWYVFMAYQFTEPRRGFRVVLAVEVHARQATRLPAFVYTILLHLILKRHAQDDCVRHHGFVDNGRDDRRRALNASLLRSVQPCRFHDWER